MKQNKKCCSSEGAKASMALEPDSVKAEMSHHSTAKTLLVFERECAATFYFANKLGTKSAKRRPKNNPSI